MLRGRKFGGRWRTYSTINETQTQKKLSHTTHTHTHDEPLLPYPERLCPLSPWVGQRCDQIMAPPLPIAMRRRRAIGVALAVVGLLVWGGLVTKIEIERGGGRHGLKWPPFYKINNNQMEDGVDVRRVDGEETRLGWNVWGGRLPVGWGG